MTLGGRRVALARARWAALRRRRLVIGRGTRLDGRLRVGGRGRVVIGPGCRITSATVYALAPESTVTIGAGCYLNGPEIVARTSIRIGDRCEIGSALVYDTDFHPLQRRPRGPVRSAPVVIGDDVWVAARTAVLRGVTVGDRSVIGLGAVVTSSVSADSLVRPAPPRVDALGDSGTPPAVR